MKSARSNVRGSEQEHLSGMAEMQSQAVVQIGFSMLFVLLITD